MIHGTYASYTIGACRCDDCRAANTRYHKRRKYDLNRGLVREVDATGSRRRIQALQRMGWTGTHIAKAGGLISRQAVGDVLTRDRVRADTARRVAVAFTELAMTPGPSSRTRIRAEKAGWVGPMHWDDIDDPHATPWQDERTPADRASHKGAGVVNEDSLTDYAEWGFPISATAAALGVSRDAVERGIKNHAPHLRDQFTRNAIAKGLAA